MASSIILLTNKNELSYTSKSVKGDGYYGRDGLHTMSYVVNFMENTFRSYNFENLLMIGSN